MTTCHLHQVGRALFNSFQRLISLKCSDSLRKQTQIHPALQYSCKEIVLLFLFYTQATEAETIWCAQAGTKPRSLQPLMYTETEVNKSSTGTKTIQAELHAFLRQGECQHRSCTYVGGWCLGLMCHWNFDIVMCMFSLSTWQCYEGRLCCIPGITVLFIKESYNSLGWKRF